MQDMETLAQWVDHNTLARKYVAAGHSFGAAAALMACGSTAAAIPDLVKPNGCSAAVALSPPPPIPSWNQTFAALLAPALIQTGTLDNVGPFSWRSHSISFFRSPPPDKYLVVFEGVDHYFGNTLLHTHRHNASLSSQESQHEKFEDFVQLSSHFLDAYAEARSKGAGLSSLAQQALSALKNRVSDATPPDPAALRPGVFMRQKQPASQGQST
mmetsp:Transcript_31065/g.73272  ORF Transcript_31065/g.73272 Transcript_31065/m.73272 type:complete len:213 (+) Transcript_31065:452-1090(+)